MNHYPRHLGDIARDTAHLSQGQFGAYDLLLDWYYGNEKPLPLNRDALYEITRARDAKGRANTDFVLSWFFKKMEDGWHQKRCDEELAKYAEKSLKASKSASARWGNSQSERNANASENAYAESMRTHNEGICVGNASQEPVTSNQLNSKHLAESSIPPCPHSEIIATYAKHVPVGRQVNPELWNGTRAKHLQARWRESKDRQSVEWWERFFSYVSDSAFLTGKVPPSPGRKPFEISLDWIVNPTNFAKIAEGAYHR